MSRPKRIQMTRQRPWRHEHPDAVIVARPTRWSNPYSVQKHAPSDYLVVLDNHMGIRACETRFSAHQEAVRLYQHIVLHGLRGLSWDLVREELAGRDLACWCPLDHPCHADVLLELANADVAEWLLDLADRMNDAEGKGRPRAARPHR